MRKCDADLASSSGSIVIDHESDRVHCVVDLVGYVAGRVLQECGQGLSLPAFTPGITFQRPQHCSRPTRDQILPYPWLDNVAS